MHQQVHYPPADNIGTAWGEPFMLDQTVVDRVTDAVMREQDEMAQAVNSQRDFAVVYVDQGGELRSFCFIGKPSGLFEELERRGVNLDRDDNSQFIGRFARSWDEPGEGRQCQSSDEEMRDHVVNLVDRLKAEQATQNPPNAAS